MMVLKKNFQLAKRRLICVSNNAKSRDVKLIARSLGFAFKGSVAVVDARRVSVLNTTAAD